MIKLVAIGGLILVLSLSGGSMAIGQETLWFGTVRMQEKIVQGRFEILNDGVIRKIVYAPYGKSPTTFRDVKQKNNQLAFRWEIDQFIYLCALIKQDSTAFKGNCTCENKQPIQVTIRKFSEEDAILQGDTLLASTKDIKILDRALSLLNNGSNWNRFDNRVCDSSSYPYKWSLFCALHQASIDVDSEYRHLRPAIQAARKAIDEITSGKKFAHLLQDYNNEAPSFDLIANVLNRAKEIIIEKISLHQ
jgi:hypothetical protein